MKNLKKAGCLWPSSLLVAALAAALGACDQGQKPRIGSIYVNNPDARACDLLLEERGEEPLVRAVRFGEQVAGEHIYRSPRLSLSFVSLADQPQRGAVVELELGEGIGDADPWERVEGTCYDRTGQPLRTPELVLE